MPIAHFEPGEMFASVAGLPSLYSACGSEDDSRRSIFSVQPLRDRGLARSVQHGSFRLNQPGNGPRAIRAVSDALLPRRYAHHLYLGNPPCSGCQCSSLPRRSGVGRDAVALYSRIHQMRTSGPPRFQCNLQIGNKAVFEILVNNCSPVSSHGGNRGNCQPNLHIHIMGGHAACPRQEGRDETRCSRGAGAERDRERHFLTRQGEWCGQPLNWVC